MAEDDRAKQSFARQPFPSSAWERGEGRTSLPRSGDLFLLPSRCPLCLGGEYIFFRPVLPAFALPPEGQRVVIDDLADDRLGVAAALHFLDELRHRSGFDLP